MQRTIYAILLLSSIFSIGFAQTPAPLNSNIDYDSDPSMPGLQEFYGVSDIQAAYTNAHRIEENQFPCIAPFSINDWIMPSQVTWDALTIDEQFFFIMNEERKARANVDYCNGNGEVKGIPMIGLEANIDNIVQFFVDSLRTNNARELDSLKNYIDRDAIIGGNGCSGTQGILANCCHEHLPRTGISLFWPYNTPQSGVFTIEIAARSLYSWLYKSSAGSRESILIQDDDLQARPTDPFGIKDNYGKVNEEGFIGVGISSGPFTDPNSGTMYAHVDYVLLGYFDPIPESEGCAYNCTSCDPCSSIINVNSIPYQDGVIQAQISIRAEGLVPSTGDVTMKAGNFVELNSVFEVAQGGIFHAYIDDCYFTLD